MFLFKLVCSFLLIQKMRTFSLLNILGGLFLVLILLLLWLKPL